MRERAHRLHVYVVLPKEAGSGAGLVQRLDMVPRLLGTGLRLAVLHRKRETESTPTIIKWLYLHVHVYVQD